MEFQALWNQENFQTCPKLLFVIGYVLWALIGRNFWQIERFRWFHQFLKILSYDDLVQSTNHVKRYILQIDEMLKDFTKMEKYLERGMAKCRDLELFFGNRTGTLDINVEGRDPTLVFGSLPVYIRSTSG